jgi:proteic killer suppression protein
MNMQYHVYFSKQAEKDIKKIPTHVAIKLQAWIDDVEERGLPAASQTPSFHDELLRGTLTGLRSIRLSLAYRAIYRKEMFNIYIIEVHKHAYKK